MSIFTEVQYGVTSILRDLFPLGNFKIDEIPDLSGQTMIVTGANVGIGRETIKVLLQHNARVYLAARSKAKAGDAINRLKEETGKEAIFLELDLSDLASVRRAAKEFLSKENQLHVLFNNAGVSAPPIDMVTADGYDLQFGTNVIGHFLFTELLMPALFSGVETSPDHHARIITISSAMAMFKTIQWDTLKDSPARRNTPRMALYSQSKFGNVVVARQIAKRYAHKGIVSLSVDPGVVKTKMLRHTAQEKGFLALLQSIWMWFILRPAPWGALTPLWAGTMPEPLNHNGEYLTPITRVARCRAEAYDDELGNRLWSWLEREVEAK